MKASLFLLTAAPALAAASGTFEWAGVFALADSSHTWSMQKVDGAYADQTMKVVLIPTETPTNATMYAHEGHAETLEAGECANIQPSETMTPAATGSCFNLNTGDADESLFTIDTTGLSGLAVYTEHVPTEFEDTSHYLYDSSDVDIEPAAQIDPMINAMFTCTKKSFVASADGGSGVQEWTVEMKIKCNMDCSVCEETDTHDTDRGAGDLMNEVCMEEDHNGEQEYILFRCKDEEDGVHVDMHVYEGEGILEEHCGTDTYEDTTEYVEYESGVCGADGHGHHAHEEGGDPVQEADQGAGSALAPSAAALIALGYQAFLA